MKPHRHAALIKQWADGHKVEILSRVDGGWHEEEYPDWDEDYTYRIKDFDEGCAECGVKTNDGYALYCVKCSEPLREWVGLTDAEIDNLNLSNKIKIKQLILLIETKLKEKNT